MLKSKILAFFLTLVFGCLGQNDSVLNQLKSLDTDSLKTAFLEGVFNEDQLIRNEWIASMNADSITLQNVLNKVRSTDSINLIKIDSYLALYQYPSKSKISDLAVLTPWLVIHHATHNEVRFRNYPILLNAYLSNDIQEDELRLYMARSLSIKTGKDYDMIYNKKLRWLKKKMQKEYDRNYSGK